MDSPPGDRSNTEWVALLRDPGPVSDGAQRDLRVVLFAGLKRALSRRGVGEDACEDFVQDALLRIRTQLGSFRGDSRFTTWALSIAVRIAFDELRRKRWKDVPFEAVTADAQSPVAFMCDADAPLERALVREQVLSALRQAIEGQLTEKQRCVLSAELAGMPHEQIARHLGMKRNALYKLSHDARRKVKAQFEAAGISGIDVLWAFE